MADEFKIVASLNIPESASRINKDIPKLEGQAKHLKIVADLNPTLSIKNIQATLNKMNNNANIKIGIDTSGLNSVQGATQNITNGLKSVQIQAQQTAKSVHDISTAMSSLKFPVATKYDADKNLITDTVKSIQNARDMFNKMGFNNLEFKWVDEAGGVFDRLKVKVTDAYGAVQEFKFLNNGSSYIYDGASGTDSGVEKLITSMQKAQDKLKALRTNLTSDLKSIRSAWQDVNGGKSVKSDENIERLKQQYIKVTQAIRELRNADDTTLASMKANADAQIDKLNQMVTQYHNAEKVATQLRAKGFETVKNDTGSNIDKFINSINNSKVPIQAMQTEINKLTSDFAQLDTIQDQAGKSAALTNILNTLDNAKTKFQSLKELFNGFGNKITKLQGIANSAVFRNNASNPQVTQTKQDINSLITAYQNLATKLQGNITPAGLETVRTELTQLNARFNDTAATAQRFEQSLKDDNGAEKLAQKIAVLTARIEAYRKANSKSEKKFGSQYNDMLSALKNPNIDENAYNRIAKQFQVIRQEVNAANVAGKNFLQTFKEKLGKFTGWMSMTYAVSLVTRTIRSMVTDVVELDTALIDLKKTFKGTNDDLKEFYRSSNDIAKQLGVTTKEVITQASAWSRLGYNTKSQIESLSQTSSIFAAISPEMDVDAATNTLVSVLKAYEKYGLKAEDALDGIASKVNAVGNNFAVSNSDIAEALQRSSASMASANTDLEHTIALITAGKFRCLYVQKCA